jgi:hypothetical protein
MGIPMGPVGGMLRNLGGQASRLLQKDYLSGALRAGVSPRGFLDNTLGPMQTAKAWANTRQMQILPAGAAIGIGVQAMRSPSYTRGIENSLNQIGPAIDRTVSNIVPDSLENWAGRTAQELEKGGLINMVGGVITAPFAAAQTYGQKGGYNTPSTGGTLPPDAGGRAYGTQATLNGKPVVWAGKDYGWQSPKTGSATMNALNSPGAQSRFIQDAAPASPGSPGDRAYAAEKERARQLTEQDPLFKKYQVAELSKQYNAATGDEREKIGMQIWAQTNPQLAAKMKPGQTGYSDVATAFQNLSPITGMAGSMPASSFAMPAASAMPGIEQTYGANVLPGGIAGLSPATAGSAVAPGAFSEKSPVDITAYLKSPVEANAKFANLDQTQLGLLRQAYNQRIK